MAAFEVWGRMVEVAWLNMTGAGPVVVPTEVRLFAIGVVCVCEYVVVVEFDVGSVPFVKETIL